MKDQEKTKEQLISELKDLRQETHDRKRRAQPNCSLHSQLLKPENR